MPYFIHPLPRSRRLYQRWLYLYRLRLFITEQVQHDQ